MSLPTHVLLTHASGWGTDAAIWLRSLMATPFEEPKTLLHAPTLPEFVPSTSPKRYGFTLPLSCEPYHLVAFRDHTAAIAMKDGPNWLVLPGIVAIPSTFYIPQPDTIPLTFTMQVTKNGIVLDGPVMHWHEIRQAFAQRIGLLATEILGLPALADPRVHGYQGPHRFANFQEWPKVPSAIETELKTFLKYACILRSNHMMPTYVHVERAILDNPLKPSKAVTGFNTVVMSGSTRDKSLQKWINTVFRSKPDWIEARYLYSGKNEALVHYTHKGEPPSSHVVMEIMETLDRLAGAHRAGFPKTFE